MCLVYTHIQSSPSTLVRVHDVGSRQDRKRARSHSNLLFAGGYLGSTGLSTDGKQTEMHMQPQSHPWAGRSCISNGCGHMQPYSLAYGWRVTVIIRWVLKEDHRTITGEARPIAC